MGGGLGGSEASGLCVREAIPVTHTKVGTKVPPGIASRLLRGTLNHRLEVKHTTLRFSLGVYSLVSLAVLPTLLSHPILGPICARVLHDDDHGDCKSTDCLS